MGGSEVCFRGAELVTEAFWMCEIGMWADIPLFKTPDTAPWHFLQKRQGYGPVGGLLLSCLTRRLVAKEAQPTRHLQELDDGCGFAWNPHLKSYPRHGPAISNTPQNSQRQSSNDRTCQLLKDMDLGNVWPGAGAILIHYPFLCHFVSPLTFDLQNPRVETTSHGTHSGLSGVRSEEHRGTRHAWVELVPQSLTSPATCLGEDPHDLCF